MPSLGWKGPIKYGLSVPPSVYPSCLSVSFLGIGSSFFFKFSIMLGAHIELCVTAGFPGKNLHQAKMVKNDPKHGFWTF